MYKEINEERRGGDSPGPDRKKKSKDGSGIIIPVERVFSIKTGPSMNLETFHRGRSRRSDRKSEKVIERGR